MKAGITPKKEEMDLLRGFSSDEILYKWVNYHYDKPDKGGEYIVDRRGAIFKIVFSETKDSPINEMWEGVRKWLKPVEYAAQSAPKQTTNMLKTIDELTEDDLVELWAAIGGTPHLFEYGKDDLKRTLITGETVDANDEPNGLQLDYYTMAAIVDTLRERGFQTLNTPIP